MSASPPNSNLALPLPATEATQAHSPSGVQEEVVALFDQMRDQLLRYLSSFTLPLPDAEEIVQETFLALFQHLQRGRPRHNLRGWLFRVAHNLALRKRQRDRRNSQSGADSNAAAQDSLIDPALNPEDRLATSETQKRLMAVLNALPEQDRRCLCLRTEGLRYREIASVLDMSLGAVSLSLERSLGRIARAAERVKT
jgi:RNA polymerase sigma-70 factor (ECF subfamily)